MMVALLAMSGWADEVWTETFGASVEKSGSYWPYVQDYTGFDHQGECTYEGWYASVRYLDRYADNGPHIYMNGGKDCRFSISGLPEGSISSVSFDIVCYQYNTTGSDYATTDVFSLAIDGQAYDFGSKQLKTDAFVTLTANVESTASSHSIEFTKPSTEATEVRIDNIKIVYVTATQSYTLDLAVTDGGTVNTSVSGSYKAGDKVTLYATPDDGYVFVQWSDGNTENPRTLYMTQDYELWAVFAAGEGELDCPYPELDGKKGNEIITELQKQISNHKQLDYDNVRADRADVDIRHDGTVWDMYSNCVFYEKSYCGYGSDFPECDCYNREHVLPKSWWGGSTTEPMYTDLHHIIPTDFVANTERSAWPFGEVSGTPDWTNDAGSKVGYGTYGSSGNNMVFEPIDEYKGDIARIYFYMLTCYNNVNFTAGGKGYQVFSYNNGVAAFTYKAKALFMKWHNADPVSQKEIDRNNAVENKQGNRNPFVDIPDLADYVWGQKVGQTYKCSSSATSIDTPDSDNTIRPQKLLMNGVLYIQMPDGQRFDARGRRVN